MRLSFALLLTLSALLAGQRPAGAAAPPPRPEPLKGAILSGRAFACVRVPTGVVWACSQPLGANRPDVEFICACSLLLPAQWHLGHGALWVAINEMDESAPKITHRDFELLQRYELAELLKGRRVTAPGAAPDEGLPRPFDGPDPVYDRRFLGGAAEFWPEVYYDYLPAGPQAVRLFVITNVGGSMTPAGKTGELVASTIHFSREDEVTPRWSFACHRTQNRYDPDEGAWMPAGWEQEETLELRFRERFHALARGDDFYFLTVSGKLYRAAKPAKGKHRKVQPVWDDPKHPVTAFLTDADSGRTFLFCTKAAKGGARPALFELGPRPRCREYDPALFKPGKGGPEEFRRVVGYARVLRALKLLKEDPPAAPAPAASTPRPGAKR